MTSAKKMLEEVMGQVEEMAKAIMLETGWAATVRGSSVSARTAVSPLGVRVPYNGVNKGLRGCALFLFSGRPLARGSDVSANVYAWQLTP